MRSSSSSSSFIVVLLINVALLLMVASSATATQQQEASTNKLLPTFGASPEVIQYYKGQKFTCFSNGKQIPIAQVNDDYCDCPDGSDEPGTSACSNGQFYCVNKGYHPELISSTYVNDGVCDCCDGSDEYSKKIDCPNSCIAKGEELRKARQEKIDRFKDGLRVKAEMIEEAKRILVEKTEELERLRKEVEPLQEKIKEHEVARETLQKRRDEEQIRLEQERDRLKEQQEKEKEQQAAQPPADTPAQATETAEQQEQEQDQEDQHEETHEEKRAAVEELKSELLETIKQDNNNNNNDDEEKKDGDGDGKDKDVLKDALNHRKRISEAQERRRHRKPKSAAAETIKSPSSSKTSTTIHTTVEPSQLSFLLDYLPPASREMLQQLIDHISPLLDYTTQLLNYTTPFLDYTTPLFETIAPYLPNSGVRDMDLGDVEAILSNARHDLREKEEKIETIQKLLSFDHGKDNVFLPLYGKCFDIKTKEYTYTLCPYDRASQGGTSLGKFEEWKSGHSLMSFQNGQQCWGGPKRSLIVGVECGAENVASDIQEPSKCEYTMKFHTPAACDEEHLKVLQLEEHHHL